MSDFKICDILLDTPAHPTLVQKIQMFHDGGKSVHVEMIVYPDAGNGQVVTIGSDLKDGLSYRLRYVDDFCKVIRCTDTIPYSDEQKIALIDRYFKEKELTGGRDYPIGNVIISGINRAIDFYTFGAFHRIDFGIYKGNSDCSSTVAELIYMIFPGKLIQRKNDHGLIPFKMVTPCDIEFANRFALIKDYGV